MYELNRLSLGRLSKSSARRPDGYLSGHARVLIMQMFLPGREEGIKKLMQMWSKRQSSSTDRRSIESLPYRTKDDIKPCSSA